MPIGTELTIVALAVGCVHFALPVLYYGYAKTRWLTRPWTLVISAAFEPQISLIVPTYNEAAFIVGKLDNIFDEDYDRNLLEVVIVDSASVDKTEDIVKSWTELHAGLRIRFINEPLRRGKLSAVLYAFDRVDPSSELLIVSDADSRFERGAIRKTAKYFADPSVGVVTASLGYLGDAVPIETVYRKYYNVIRIAESKRHSTPIHSGVFQALRASAIRKIGVPTFAGSDDSAIASYLAFAGFRSIQVEDVLVREPMRGSQFLTKVRRAQCVVLNFLLTKKYAKRECVYVKTEFEKIWRCEFWLNIVNPWILVLAIFLLAVSIGEGLQAFSLSVVLIGFLPLGLKTYRSWVSQQLYLIIGCIRNFVTRAETWTR